MSKRLPASLLILLLTAALFDLPGPTQEPWHTWLYALTLGLGAVLAVRANTAGRPLRFGRMWALCLLLGQLLQVGFPFARFDMFTRAIAAEQTHYLYRAQHASGVERAFEPGALLPTLGYSRLLLGLHEHMAALESIRTQGLPPEEIAYAELRVREVLEAALRIYNQREPGDPIKRLDVYRAQWRRAAPDRLDDHKLILQVSLR